VDLKNKVNLYRHPHSPRALLQNTDRSTHSHQVHGFHVDIATQLSHMRITSSEALVHPHPSQVLFGIPGHELNMSM
jgi:hypothetical protein